MLHRTLLSVGVQAQAATRSAFATSSSLAQRHVAVRTYQGGLTTRLFGAAGVIESQSQARHIAHSCVRRSEQDIGSTKTSKPEQQASESSSSSTTSTTSPNSTIKEDRASSSTAHASLLQEKAAGTAANAPSPSTTNRAASTLEAKKNMWDTLLRGSLFNQPNSASAAVDDLSGRHRRGTSSRDAASPLSMREEMDRAWRQQPCYGLAKPGKPSDGRTVEIDHNRTDVSRAFMQLNGILRRNNVRHELRLVERYEKPSQKRRRLASERHRRRFADAVYQKVQLVMRLRARGA